MSQPDLPKHYVEGLEKYKEFSWIIERQKPKSILKTLTSKLLPSFASNPSFIDVKDENISKSTRRKIVLLALEKLNTVNPHAFPHSEQIYLNPTRVGVLAKTYYLFSMAPFVFGMAWMIAGKRYSGKNLAIFGLGYYTTFQILPHIPMTLKERTRMYRARNLADKYYHKHGGLDLFKKIVDPRTDIHELSHLKL